MTAGTTGSDAGLGAGLAFAAIVVVGAALMYVGPSQINRAAGFGVAMVAALLAVSAFHLLE